MKPGSESRRSLGRTEPQGQHRSLETGIDAEQLAQTPEHQSRARQEYQLQAGDLPRGEHVAAVAPEASAFRMGAVASLSSA